MKGVIRSSAARPDGLCISCRRSPAIAPITDRVHTRLYCNRSHKKMAQAVRSGRKQGTLRGEGKKDSCLYCGAAIESTMPVTFKLCGDPSCRKKAKFRGFDHFKKRVKWPHDLTWLGPKLGLSEDDPRLPELAIKLAEAGKMIVLLRADESVGLIGRPKEKQWQQSKSSSATHALPKSPTAAGG